MTFQPATVNLFLASFRFADLRGVNTTDIAQALDEGLRYVGQNWVCEEDFQLGQMLYAAHVLTLAGLGTTVEAELARDGLLGFDSITSGKLSVSRRGASGAGSGAGGASDSLSSTKHGKEYIRLRRANLAGPRVATL